MKMELKFYSEIIALIEGLNIVFELRLIALLKQTKT